MAAALADALRAAKTSFAYFTLESAAAYDNVVEVKYVMTDSALFSRMKSADANQLRRFRAGDYCNNDRIAYLRQGVTVYEIFATSEHSDRVYVSIDNKICGDARCGLEPRTLRGCIHDDRFMKPNGFDR